MSETLFKVLETKGYDVFEADRSNDLVDLRQKIFDRAKTLVPYRGEDVAAFFNNFHQYEVQGPELNRLRLNLIDYCTKELKLNRSIFQAFESKLTQLLGADIAAQKVVNLVIQQPGDPDQVPIHRDAPTNSNFEIVVWLPLGDVYGSKGMFVADRSQTFAAAELLKSGRSFKDFSDKVEANSLDVVVPFGSALFFAAGLAHGCRVNREKETRWVLNVRYKNLYSPYGQKGLVEFFEILKLSALSKVGFAFEQQIYG